MIIRIKTIKYIEIDVQKFDAVKSTIDAKMDVIMRVKFAELAEITNEDQMKDVM